MKALEAQTPQPYSLPLPKAGYAIVGLLAIFIAVITGLNWQAGLTLTLVLAYMVVISVRLEWGIYIIVAFAVLCIDGWAPNRSPEDVVFRLSIGHIYIMEFAVYGLLASYFVRRALDKRPVSDRRFFAVTPLGTPLKVFAALLPLFAIYGLALGNATKEALGYEEWRSLFMAIVLYFLLTTIIRTREEALKLFWWFLGLNTILGLFSLALYFLGSQGPLPLIFGSGPVGEGPENYTFMFAALCAIAWLLFCRGKYAEKRNLVLLSALIPVLNVLLSEKRDPQLGLVVGLLVLTWRMPLRKKVKWGGLALGAGATVLLFASAVGMRAKNSGLEGSTSRYAEVEDFIKNPRPMALLQSQSVGDTLAFHIFDLVDSFNSFRLRPILGYGFGGHFQRVYTSLVGGDFVEPGIVHDQYLDFCIKMGLVGLFAFLWVLAQFVTFSLRNIPRPPVWAYDAIALGFVSAMCGDMAVEIWGPSWRSQTKMPVIFLFSFAMVVCLLRRSNSNAIVRAGKQDE